MQKRHLYQKDIFEISKDDKIYQLKELIRGSNRDIDNDLEVEFFQPRDTYGWIDIIVKTSSYKTVIETSNVYNPYFEFVWWLEGVLINKFPIIWEIDEEGSYQRCYLFELDYKNLRLIINRELLFPPDGIDKKSIVVDTILPKNILFKRFYLAFKKFIESEYSLDYWGSYDDLRVSLRKLEKSLEHFS